jgi:hypothetical protein
MNTNEIFATTTPLKANLVQTSGTWNLQKAVGSSYKLFFQIPADPAQLEELNIFENALYL